MPTKTTTAGREYDIDGKTFVWHPEDDDGATGNLPDIRIPLRVKLKVLRAMNDAELDAAAMFAILEAIAPGQSDALDEMDMNDFSDMFTTWQIEYQAMSGASLEESSGSSAS